MNKNYIIKMRTIDEYRLMQYAKLILRDVTFDKGEVRLDCHILYYYFKMLMKSISIKVDPKK